MPPLMLPFIRMYDSFFPLHRSFSQLAQDEGSPVRGFGVVEYESAEQAEAVLIEMDRTLVGGQEVRLSLCSPGTSGRSTLAALIAAQGMVSTTPWSHDRLARSFSSHALQLCVCVCVFTHTTRSAVSSASRPPAQLTGVAGLELVTLPLLSLASFLLSPALG